MTPSLPVISRRSSISTGSMSTKYWTLWIRSVRRSKPLSVFYQQAHQRPLPTETFNEFFYRKLKPSARPVEKPSDPYRLVSAADCRFMSFTTVDDATRLWIKGREFTVARLLGDAYKDQAERYVGGALAIFRLAPQDYHRFHSPVEGRIGPMTYIAGEYYTVNVGFYFSIGFSCCG